MTEPPYEPPPRRRALWGWVLLGLLGYLGLYVAWQAVTWPAVADLATRRPRTTAFIEDYRQGAFFGLGPDRTVEWTWVPYNRISGNLKRAVLCAEDLRFFSHEGFDETEMKAALEDAWEDKELPRGASTLTQQLAKNLWLSPSYNPLRKVKEAILTRQLEDDLTKKRILHLYLNVAEFGPGIYGAEAAARHYYHRSAANLTERQAAELAASLPAPKTWHPGSTSRRYQRHIRTVQRRMARAGWLRRVV
jgi:monofunctional biosynthetic peptidoglycan transglycosylase